MVRHKMKHERFHRLMAKMQRASPPSISTLDDESTNGWLDEADVPESDAACSLGTMPDVTRKSRGCTLFLQGMHRVPAAVCRAYHCREI